MDSMKTGRLIAALRKEQGLTQKQLADALHLSDRTISKWERGLGFPDISLLPGLSRRLGVDMEQVLKGELDEQEQNGGNMKKAKYYVCGTCGNLVVALSEVAVSCCGRPMEAAVPQKAEDGERLTVQRVEDEWFVTADHPMTKEHFISFTALVTGERLQLVKHYPEWNLEVRFPARGHGMLLWYCTAHGLFYQLV